MAYTLMRHPKNRRKENTLPGPILPSKMMKSLLTECVLLNDKLCRIQNQSSTDLPLSLPLSSLHLKFICSRGSCQALDSQVHPIRDQAFKPSIHKVHLIRDQAFKPLTHNQSSCNSRSSFQTLNSQSKFVQSEIKLSKP
ncbi:hypothetical protein M9H77_22990 [Catharanthus roseus]|uniref:Uncharacterized protein n=1 Tax=Catharanthus roseus TaxID=4058 RepID=A0ACC0AT86_CATRO|nr:hypothetical protein M9H77_22990 [Catharanthus roseus]